MGAAGADPLFSGTWGSSSVVCEEVSSSVDDSSSFASFMTDCVVVDDEVYPRRKHINGLP